MNDDNNKNEQNKDSDLSKVIAEMSELKQQLRGIKKTLKVIAYLVAIFIVGVVIMFLVRTLVYGV